jgi:hypothetical protein
MANVLTVHELDDLRNWARAAQDEDPDDEFPPLLLRLLDENAELRTLLYGAKESGELAAATRLADEVDRLRSAEKEWARLEGQYKERVKELEDRINLHALVLEKLVKTLGLARDRLVGGEGTKPEVFSRLLEMATREYDEDKRRRGL